MLKNYYPWWRIDENISWHNVNSFIFNAMHLKFKKYKFWLPPKIERGDKGGKI